MTTGNIGHAISFLKRIHPRGPWCLTSIAVDRKGIRTDTFYPDQENECREWLAKYNGERNIYFHINPVKGAVTKKAEREDIAAMTHLHVDVDPRPGEELSDERDRALRLLREPPQGVPAPTCIIFSGGGYQAFWQLEEPVPINGDLALAEDAKRYNMQLELVFGADNCHNIDRLCRLPGTLNIPDAKKRKKGRAPEVAEVVEYHEDRIYPITQFKAAQAVQLAGEAGFSSGKTVKISGNIPRLDSVEDLDEWNVPDRVRVIIVQGKDPDNPKEGDNSRSAWLFDCICQLVRAGVPDETIFSILTDPDFLISESVLDKGSSAEKYAVRQIERAKEEVIEPWLRKLNESHAVIENMGGKCRVIEEVMDYALKRTRLTRQSFDDFRNRYMNTHVQIGINKDGMPIMKPLGKWWLEHQMRRQYKTLVFAPGQEVANAYNLWKGFACEARPGDCSAFLEHVEKNICGGNKEYYTYMLGWMARCIQQPDSPGQVAIVLRGGMGTGKSFFAKQIGALFGRHFLQVADPKHLVGSFNAHLRDCIVLFGDEAFYAGDKKHESVLRMLITEEVITIESKGVDAEAAPNYVHVILASNNNWVVPAGADERRYFVLDVSDQRKQDTAYFRGIAKIMDEGGREALLHYLMNYDLSSYEVRKVPKTTALGDQKRLSMSNEQEWWFGKLDEGRLLPHEDNWRTEIIKDELFDDYVDNMRRNNTYNRANRTALGMFLKDVVPGLRSQQKSAKVAFTTHDGFTIEKQRRPHFYILPSLEECRKAWDQKFGEQDWAPIAPETPEFPEVLQENDETPF